MDHEDIYRVLKKREQQNKPLSARDLKRWCSDSIEKREELIEALIEEQLAWSQPTRTTVKEGNNILWGKPKMGFDREGETAEEASDIPVGSLVKEVPITQVNLLNQIMNEVEQSGIDPTIDEFPYRVIEELLNRNSITVQVRDFREWLEATYPDTSKGSVQSKQKKKRRPRAINSVLEKLLRKYPGENAKQLWNRLYKDQYSRPRELDSEEIITEINPYFSKHDDYDNKSTRLEYSNLQTGKIYKPMTFETFEKRLSEIRCRKTVNTKS